MKRTHILVIVLSIFLYGTAKAQGQFDDADIVPPFAIGLRANPDGVGISGKYFLIEPVSVEAMINGSGGTYYSNGPSVTFVGLIEYNFIFDDPSWRIFLGGGAHVTSWKEHPDNNAPRQTLAGLDVIGGVEYVFTEVPIGISLDIKPAMNFTNGVTSFPNNTFGLGIRYYFGNWSKKLAEHDNTVQDGR